MDKDYFVHESSYVDDNVSIGKGTKIWHFCHVQSGAVIGERCSLGQNVNVGNNVKIGNGVRVQNNVSIYEGVEIEDNVFCGPSCVFTNVATHDRTISTQGSTLADYRLGIHAMNRKMSTRSCHISENTAWTTKHIVFNFNAFVN